MRLPARSNQRLDPGRGAEHHIGVAEVTIVRQQDFRLAEVLGQSVELVQHRLDLLLVVGRRTTRAATTKRLPGYDRASAQDDRVFAHSTLIV